MVAGVTRVAGTNQQEAGRPGAQGGEKFDPAAEFSAAGQPVDMVAILIVGAVLLAVVLIVSQLVGNLFEKSGK